MLSLDLSSLRSAYARGEITPSDLVDGILDRIRRHADPAVWINLLPREQLQSYARAVESNGPKHRPLYGVPFAIKDNIDLAGVPTTAGCPAFSHVPGESAPVVQRLITAGAIPIGKTNLDQFATGLVGVRSPYGVPRNPFHAANIPGGSSSGSAVAVAAGLVSFALGTDTAGSGRVPAGFNNIVGLKPTRGAISTRGVVPACRSLDCVSIFALTCSDAAEIHAVAAGFDPADPFAREPPGFAQRADAAAGVRRIGVPRAGQLFFSGDAEALRLFDASRECARRLGMELVEIDFTPFQQAARLLYQGPWIAERWAALRSFHDRRADAILPVTRQIIESGRGYSAADAFAGAYELAAIARQAAMEWRKTDVLLVPTAPRPYTLAEVAAEPVAWNTELGTYTNFANLLDLAAIAVPAGRRRDGFPTGVSFLAPAWSEPALLQLGTAWHRAIGGTLGATSIQLSDVGRTGAGQARTLDIRSPSTFKPAVRLAVVGAHLSGLPLNHQLTGLGGRLAWSGNTAPNYRLYALPGTVPPKPGLLRVHENGTAIPVEVWELEPAAFGAFVAAVPAPLCIGTVALAEGEMVKGFLCEPAALAGAEDITHYGGWRAYLRVRETVHDSGSPAAADGC